MKIPAAAGEILNTLIRRGYSAYVVGGCVRDSLLGKTPEDWDICTSALPEETEACFPEARVVETGLRHGTVTVILGGTPYEITTFRRDGAYGDHRRPERVEFVTELREDLGRRDFTINAMAAAPDGQIQDPFGGQMDLERGLIRCVGDPETRFSEDALRILRGLRFAARLGFTIEEETARAMEDHKALLRFVSPERVYKELTGILEGPYVGKVLADHGSVLTAVLPEIGPCMGFLQHHPSHHLDVWGHTVAAVAASKPDIFVRWALLLHDIGKPQCFSMDEAGCGHFYGHGEKSGEMAREIFSRLRADKQTRDTVCLLVEKHGIGGEPTEHLARRWLNRFGKENTERLIEVKRCDCLAHADIPMIRREREKLAYFASLVQEALEQDACVSLKTLAVGGKDILALGIPPGPQVGALLSGLLEDVLEGRCENDRQALLSRLREKSD